MTDKQRKKVTADVIRDRAISLFESQVSQQLSKLPHAPYTVQVAGYSNGYYCIKVGNASDANLMTHLIGMLDEHHVWLIVTLVKGQIYNVPPPPPEVDLAEIERTTTALKQHVERLQGKLTEEREKGAGWEARATLAEAKLASIRLMTLAELRTTDAKARE